MNALYTLRDMLCGELENVVSNSQGNIPLDIIDKITHSLKSVETIIAMKEKNSYDNNGYNTRSYNNGSYANNSYRNNSYRNNNYANNGSYMGGNGYRSNRSYADSKEEMMGELHEMMNEAKSEQERQAFQQFINQLQNM